VIYRFSISTPKNTPFINRKRTELRLTAGIINQVNFTFPPGCAGLLHLTINHGLYQIWPTNPEESFATDGETISFEEFYELKTEPFTLVAFTWNEDDTYDHTVIVRIGLLPRTVFPPWQVGWQREVLV